MSRDSATSDLKEEADEHDTGVASTSLENFQSTVAGFRFNPLPSTRRSARILSKVVQCEEAEYEEGSVKSKVLKSTQSKSSDVVKRKKKKRGYAEPERYAHLNGLPDILGDELDGNSSHPTLRELILFKCYSVDSSQSSIDNSQYRD